MKWIDIKTRMPDPYVAILTQHVDDLYPITAFTLPDNGHGVEWWVHHEGPEDANEHLLRPLLTPPTHWAELPPPPEKKD